MDVLALDSRRAVYQHIARHPGKHLRELQRDLGMAMGAMEYHLDRLVKADLVSVASDGHKRFFATDVPRADKPRLAALRQAAPRRILITLTQRPGCSMAELERITGLPRSTVRYHVGRLAALGLLSDDAGAWSVPDGADCEALYMRYHASLLDRWVDGFLAASDALRLPPSQKP